MQYMAEYTDLFAGEANYSWVRRATFDAPRTATNKMLVRRAKRALGVTGKHRTSGDADLIVVYPTQTLTLITIQPSHHYTEG